MIVKGENTVSIFLGKNKRERRLIRCINCGRVLCEVIKDVLSVIDSKTQEIKDDNRVIIICRQCKYEHHIHNLV